ncbi:MAG: phytochelatin synthase family protein [Geminicoccaceae bacterium]
MRIAAIVGVAAALGWSAALADSLPLPPNLIDVRSEQGEKLLLEADALDAYVPLSVNFVTQKLQSFCGVASIVIVLNALDVPAPTTPEYEPYHTFTQDNFLDERTETILPREVLTKQGMTLDQLGALLRLHPVEATVNHAADSSVDQFRAAAREHLGQDGRAVIVNYLRKAIGQERGGHISPLAAYDAETDRFLILDVARYKYPPVWVTAADLFAAMNTTDSDNENRTRGYVLVVRKAEVAAAPVN